MPFAAALSEHPDPAQAVGECIGQLLDANGPHPDLLVAFVGGPHRRALGEIGAVAQRLLRPACQVAIGADAVIGGPREVEGTAAVSLWAGWSMGAVTGLHLPPDAAPGPARSGPATALEAQLTRGGGRSVLLFVDPYTTAADRLVERLAAVAPGTVVVGGLCAGRRPGETVLQLDGQRLVGGSLAVVLDQPLDTVVSQGCRPVGEPFTVTRAQGNVVEELGSRAALTRLQELALALTPQDRTLLAQGVHLGRVVDEHLIEHRRGDFLVRQVLGAHQHSGGLVVGDEIPIGATVQFQIRDADTAREDLVELLGEHRGAAALVFSCAGRGVGLFGEPDHDARTVAESLHTAAVAGLFCAGEIGPVGSRSFLHGSTASVAVFRERSDRG